jgi:hypothetical protein
VNHAYKVLENIGKLAKCAWEKRPTKKRYKGIPVSHELLAPLHRHRTYDLVAELRVLLDMPHQSKAYLVKFSKFSIELIA